MSKVLIFLINLYQKYIVKINLFLRRDKNICYFYPTCSEYTKQSIQKYGSIKGSILGAKRICRCHPWQKADNFDPIP